MYRRLSNLNARLRSLKIQTGDCLHLYLHKFRLSGIPPPAGGGWFNPDLQDTQEYSGIPPPAGGGWFNPDLRAQQRKTRVGIEPSTTCRWWDSGKFSSSCRLGLNDPPAPAGGIRLNIICVDTNGLKPTADARDFSRVARATLELPPRARTGVVPSIGRPRSIVTTRRGGVFTGFPRVK